MKYRNFLLKLFINRNGCLSLYPLTIYTLFGARIIFKICVVLCGFLVGAAIYYRTTNIWALKNLADSFLYKQIGLRPIIIGTFNRMKNEQNVDGHFVVMQFIGDSRMSHSLYCFSNDENGETSISRAHIQRIHKGKRAATDVCSWSGHIAECHVAQAFPKSIRVSTVSNINHSIEIAVEPPLINERHKLVVCIAPMYTYTDWQTMLLGIETWLILGATKLIVPIQSATKAVYTILKQYEKAGLVVIRHWPKLPILSDVNPNGLVLSRGIEESHVNCLFYVKPWAEMVAFTDIDDLLLPVDPATIYQNNAVDLLQNFLIEHPQAGSFLFEHKDVQIVLPEGNNLTTLANFNFNFLEKTRWKSTCKVWRMKTRVIAIANRVDTVNMHETGIHRFGYVQVHIPCHKGHFYHMRHSHREIGHESLVSMTFLMNKVNKAFSDRINSELLEISRIPLNRSSTESFEDFDSCIKEINREHLTLVVSRCMTPHVCYSRSKNNMACITSAGYYKFSHSSNDFIIALVRSNFTNSNMDCESSYPQYLQGNYFYLP